MENRLDPFYYKPEFLLLEQKLKSLTQKKLKDFILSITGGATPLKAHQEKFYTNSENGIPLLRVQNITEEGLVLKNLVYINKETHEKYLKRSQVYEDNLLVTITGRIASSTVAPKGFIGNINQHSVVIKTKNRNDSELLASFLNSSVGQKLAFRRTTGGTRPALDYKALKSIPIVENPTIIRLFNNAVAKKTLKLIEARKLISSNENYLFDQLGIEPKTEKLYALKDRVQILNAHNISQRRFDPFYYNIYFEQLIQAILSSRYPVVNISEVSTKVDNGRTPSKVDYIKDNSTSNPIIKAGSYSEGFIDLQKVDFVSSGFKGKIVYKDDIFILSSAHQAEYVGRKVYYLNEEPYKDTFFVGELIRITTDKNLCLPKFLFQLLSSQPYSDLINREKRGQTSHIYPVDIKKIEIPLPPMEKQIEIINYISKIGENVKLLRNEAHRELQKAKEEIEKIILGE